MILISHRGLLNGPNKNLENKPSQIEAALNLGFDVEIDLWYEQDLKLGHDGPQYLVSKKYLRNPNFWIHCKNLKAFEFCLANDLHCFWHENDHMTLTSKKIIWTYPGKELSKTAITVLPEVYMDIEKIDTLSCLGICSDYISFIKEKLQK